MRVFKRSAIALIVAAGTSQWAVASQQSDAQGFVEDSKLNLLYRNFYMNREYRNGAGNQFDSATGRYKSGYREEWAHGLMLNYASGFTQGIVGFGVDAYGMVGMKLDGGKGRQGNKLMPTGADGPEDEFSEGGGSFKMRVSNTVLQYGEMKVSTPVFDTSDSRLLPETTTGFLVTSSEIKNLKLQAGHFTAFNAQASTNSNDGFYFNYADAGDAKTVDFAGGVYRINDQLSTTLFFGDVKDAWHQYYGNVNWVLPLSASQSLKFDSNIYRTTDSGKSNLGDINNTAASFAGSYSVGAHTFTLSYQKIHGDTPLDYVVGDSIYLNNSVQYSDFNGPGEKSWMAQYRLNMATYGVPGLTLMSRYVKGTGIDELDVSAASAYAGYYGDDGRHWERDLEAKYVIQSGPAKDLSLRLRQATHRANSDQGEGSRDEVRFILEYPLSIL